MSDSKESQIRDWRKNKPIGDKLVPLARTEVFRVIKDLPTRRLSYGKPTWIVSCEKALRSQKKGASEGTGKVFFDFYFHT